MLSDSKYQWLGSLDLLTPADSDPVTVDEMKAHARLDTIPEGNAYMSALIGAATQAAVRITGRALLTETWTLTLDRWPGVGNQNDYSYWWDGVRDGALSALESTAIQIRKAPFISVSAVDLLYEDGSTLSWDSTKWYSFKEAQWGKLVKRYGQVWPVLAPPVRQRGGIRITFTAGYGTDATDVPAPIRQAIKMLAADYYEHREAVGEQGRKAMQEPPLGVTALLAPFRVIR